MIKSEVPVQPLLGDVDATDLGYIVFQPDGREPRRDEAVEQDIKKISNEVTIGRGAMPRAREVPEITQE